MTTFLDTSRELPYCKGCGHPHVLHALDEALLAVEVPRHRIALVTDIGCVGLADAHFPDLHTVHALHGRAAALATGLQLASTPSSDGPLKPVVLVGDGGSTIGLLHLVHAAQLDVDVTVLVHNNLIYGMTGGQHSGFTPEGFKTTTTPDGCDIPPLDLAQVLGGAGCGYFARARAPGDDLVGLIAEGIRRPGFACIEAFELCPTFASRVGGMTGKGLKEMTSNGGLSMGVLHGREPRERPLRASKEGGLEDLFHASIRPDASLSRLEQPFQVVLAGRAGEHVQSAAKFVALAAAAAGLGAALKTDNPVTQGRGFSVAELSISPSSVTYTGLDQPDLAIVTAPEGLQQLVQRGLFQGPGAPRRVLLDEGLEAPAGLRAEKVPLRKQFGASSSALGALVQVICEEGWLEEAAWSAALEMLPGKQQAATRRVLQGILQGMLQN